MPPAGGVNRQPTGGDWWALSEQVEQLIAELEGSVLAHWRAVLKVLVSAAQSEAGSVGEREIEAAGDSRQEAA